MTAEVISCDKDEVVVQVKIKLKDSMLESEESILSGVNEVGAVATQEVLKHFDADGSKIVMGNVQWYSKGQVLKQYQTPYGQIEVHRHLYQTNEGGKTFSPLDDKARIITSSTPRYAKVLTHKYAHLSAGALQRDMAENHGISVPRSFLQNLSEAVGAIAQAKEEDWEYVIPELDAPVASVGISLDAASLLTCDEGYRMAMAGSVSLYDASGERKHTTYVAAAPEYGKETFIRRFEKEILNVKKRFPDAVYVGVADGAKDNWSFLEKHCDKQLLDFYHVTEYLSEVSNFVEPKAARLKWLAERCHTLDFFQNYRRNGQTTELSLRGGRRPTWQSRTFLYVLAQKRQILDCFPLAKTRGRNDGPCGF